MVTIPLACQQLSKTTEVTGLRESLYYYRDSTKLTVNDTAFLYHVPSLWECLKSVSPLVALSDKKNSAPPYCGMRLDHFYPALGLMLNLLSNVDICIQRQRFKNTSSSWNSLCSPPAPFMCWSPQKYLLLLPGIGKHVTLYYHPQDAELRPVCQSSNPNTVTWGERVIKLDLVSKMQTFFFLSGPPVERTIVYFPFSWLTFGVLVEGDVLLPVRSGECRVAQISLRRYCVAAYRILSTRHSPGSHQQEDNITLFCIEAWQKRE